VKNKNVVMKIGKFEVEIFDFKLRWAEIIGTVAQKNWH